MTGRDVRVISLPPGRRVGSKRNIALQESHGEIITWFDDDDWQHPHKLAWLVEALHNGVLYAGARGWCGSGGMAVLHRSWAAVVFNSAGFRRKRSCRCGSERILCEPATRIGCGRWPRATAAKQRS